MAGISLQDFFSFEISLQNIFSWNHPITPPSKVKELAPNKGEVQVTVNGILSLQRFARVDFLCGDKAAT